MRVYKIAFINIFQGAVERGLETYVNELSGRLSQKYQVDVLSGSSQPLTRWPILWRFYLDPHGIKIAIFTIRMLSTIWRKRYDVVFPLNGGWQSALIRFVTWIYGGRVVIPGQSGPGWDERINLWSFPDVFIALTEKGKFWAKSVNPFVKVLKIANGVDLAVFTPKGKNYIHNLPHPVVLCQGAAEPSKRLDLAIKAVTCAKELSLLVVGSGSLSGHMNDLGKRLLGERFLMISLPHKEMPSVYRSCDVFTLPSLSTEAFGISYVEAMASNLPVVAPNDLTRREIVGQAGLFCDPADIDLYAKSLLRVAKDKWKFIPRSQAEKFDWADITLEYEKLIANITR